MSYKYKAYAKEVIREISKSEDQDMLYKFIKEMCNCSKETTNFNIPIVKKDEDRDKENVVEKQPLWRLKDCPMHSNCYKCYRYILCKEDEEGELKIDEEISSNV